MNSTKIVGIRWWLQRVTAIIIAIGLLVHFLVLHYFTSRPINFEAVTSRLTSPWWVAFDLTLLATVLWHALNGLYGVVQDYAPSEGVRRFIMWALWIVGICAFFFGIIIIAPFTRR